MDEELRKELINTAGTYKIVPEVLTDSREIKQNDVVEVPWTSKEIIERDLNQ